MENKWKNIFKNKKNLIIFSTTIVAILMALVLTYSIIKYNKMKNDNSQITVNPIEIEYNSRIKNIDEQLTNVNLELSKVSVKIEKNSFTKDNFYLLDEDTSNDKIDSIEANVFSFVNEDIYLVKLMPISNLIINQTFYYKNNEIIAVDIEDASVEYTNRYYLHSNKVIAEKVLMSTDENKKGKIKLYIDPDIFKGQEKILVVAANNYNYTTTTSIETKEDALEIANKEVLIKGNIVTFDKMQMIENNEYYVFKESNKIDVVSYVCVNKETGKVMYKDTKVNSNTLLTKENWLSKYEEIALKIFYPNKDGTKTIETEYKVNKTNHNKNAMGELAKIINQELGLGINTIKINESKAIVDISKLAQENKFDNGSTGSIMAIESLTKTIFANTLATTIKVTVDGQGQVYGNHFSFVEDFVK